MTPDEARDLIRNYRPGDSQRDLREAIDVLERESRRGGIVSGAIRNVDAQLVDRARSILEQPGTPAGLEPVRVERPGDSVALRDRQIPGTLSPEERAERRQAGAAGGAQGAIDEQVAGTTGGAEEDERNIIGGYFQPGYRPGDVMRGASTEEPYYEHAERDLLRGMPSEELVRVQEILVAAGLTNSVIPGEIDPGTVAGFKRLLEMANTNGERWIETVNRLQRGLDDGTIDDVSAQAGQVEPGFVEQTFLPPDPAELRGSIRDLAERIVPDVDLSDEEVDFLRSQFEQFGQQEFEEAEGLRRQEFDAATAAAETGEDQTTPMVPSQAEVANSTAGRFREFFEERYAPNIERADEAEQELGRREVTQGNLGRLLQFATGRA